MQEIVPLSVHSSLVAVVPELASTAVGVTVTATAYEYRQWRESSKEEKEKARTWFKEVEVILSNAELNSKNTLLRSDFNRKALAEDFNDYSTRLNTKVETAPDRVPDKAKNLIRSLIPIYKKGATVAEVTDEKAGYEALAEVFEMAQKEYTEDSDMNSAMRKAADQSELFDNITSEMAQLGMDTEEFSRYMEELLAESKTEDFLSLIAEFGDGESIESTLSLPIRIFLEISVSFSQEAQTHIEGIERAELGG